MPFAAAASDAPLADAVQQRDGAAVDRLLDARADVNAVQVDGMTALHWAAYHDDAGLVGRLAEAGADVNARNRYGVFPLALAAENGNAAMVRRLLEAGADAGATLPGGETVLMTAARSGGPGSSAPSSRTGRTSRRPSRGAGRRPCCGRRRKGTWTSSRR